MHKEGIIVTGANGFLGTNLFSQTKDKDFLTINRNDITSNGKLKLYSRESSLTDKDIDSYDNFTLIHLATYFSKEKQAQDEIRNANILFGNEVLRQIDNLNIRKIIYTNSMYSFYEDNEARESFYCITKNLFSETLQKYTDEKSILFEEIFIDNNFGVDDKRLKIMPIILESLKKKSNNPIKNPDSYMNLLFIDDVVKRINYSVTSKDSGGNCFIDSKMLKLDSIYNFIENYIFNKSIEPTLLKYKENNYINDYPEVDLKNIKITPHEKSLITVAKEVLI